MRHCLRLGLSALYHEGGDTDKADRITASFPNYSMIRMHQRTVKLIAEADKYVAPSIIIEFRQNSFDREILDGLKKVGFRLNWGLEDAGFALTAWEKAGGYYLGKIP